MEIPVTWVAVGILIVAVITSGSIIVTQDDSKTKHYSYDIDETKFLSMIKILTGMGYQVEVNDDSSGNLVAYVDDSTNSTAYVFNSIRN